MKRLWLVLLSCLLVTGVAFARFNPIQVMPYFQEVGSSCEIITATGNNWVSLDMPVYIDKYVKMVKIRSEHLGNFNWTVVQDGTRSINTANVTGKYQQKPLDGLLGLDLIAYPPSNAVSLNVTYSTSTGNFYAIYYGKDKNQD